MRYRQICTSLFIVLIGVPVAAEVISVGGQNGLDWQSGGGTIPAQVIRGAQSVENTNAPGGVIAFSPEGFEGWILPQRADVTLNIALGANSADRGGSITSPNIQSIRGELFKIIDNDGSTGLDLRLGAGASSAQVLGLIIDLDLGARFGVGRFRFFPRNAAAEFPAPQFPYHNDFMRSFEIFINDGTPETKFEGVPIRQSVALVGQNEEPVVDIPITPQYVRFVRLKSLTATGFDIAELQVFGTGFVPEAVYISNIFDFGDLALLGKLRWVQEHLGDDQLSRIAVRTRTGNNPSTVQFNKVRPAERIFRVGGGNIGQGQAGASSGLGSGRSEVPWKFAKDVEDEALKRLIEEVLDNEGVQLRDAIQAFNSLSLDERNLITLSEADYKKLSSGDRGAVRNDVVNWSEWSAPYALDEIGAAGLDEEGVGMPIVSPGPRRYFQFMIEFFSDEFESAVGVGGLAFDLLVSPFAEQLIAEIVPRTAAVGSKTEFTYAVLTKFRPGLDRGFDQLQIDTPLRVEKVGQISIQRSDGTSLEADFSGAILEQFPLRRGDFSIVEVEEHGILFQFPLIEADQTQLQVSFDNTVLRFGTTFSGRVLNSATGEVVVQNLMAGNAAELGSVDPDVQPLGTPFEGNLSLSVPISGDLLINVDAFPPVFTPNGDGVNDRALIRYDLTNVGQPTGLEIWVYDLAGRPLRQLYDDRDASGRFARPWDGRDDGGKLVPPGNYVFSVTLDAKTGKARAVGAVSVAY